MCDWNIKGSFFRKIVFTIIEYCNTWAACIAIGMGMRNKRGWKTIINLTSRVKNVYRDRRKNGEIGEKKERALSPLTIAYVSVRHFKKVAGSKNVRIIYIQIWEYIHTHVIRNWCVCGISDVSHCRVPTSQRLGGVRAYLPRFNE